MKDIKKISPKALSFIICRILIIVMIFGLFSLSFFGFINNNILYIIIGIIGFTILIFEFIKTLKSKIIFYENYIYFSIKLFDKYLLGENCQKVNYIDIIKIKLQIQPVQFIVIKCKNNKKPIIIYVKQFSKKQVDFILKELKERSINYIEN